MFIHEDEELTHEQLLEYIELHQAQVPRFNELWAQYTSRPPILDEEQKEEFKPDNRLVVNHGRKLVETFNGYFAGISPKINHDDEVVSDAINDFWKRNDFGDVFAELSKLTSLYGVAYLYIWQDEETKTRVIHNPPLDMFVIKDNSIEGVTKYGVRYKFDDDNGLIGTLITGGEIIDFNEKGFLNSSPHYYPIIPIIEFVENDEQQSIIRPVETLINAYNKTLSFKMNDADYFSDAYMKILGAELDLESIQHIKDNRIINLFGQDGTSGIDVNFLDKPDGNTSQEMLLDRIERLIFQLTIGFNPNGESYTQASGVALDKMTLPMQNLAGTKERKFTKGLNSLMQCFTSLPTNVPASKRDSWIDIEYRFTRNIPRNLNDEAEVARALEGIISKETQLSILSVVDDVKLEIEKMEDERELPMYDFEIEEGQEINPVPSEDTL